MSEVENPPKAGATEESIEEVEDTESPPKTQIEYDRYIHKFELFDSDKYEYVPWDPTTYNPPPPPKEDLHNYFHVVSRYDSESSVTPKLLINNWSKTLVRFMRTFVGEPFFDSRPEYKVQRFFPKLEQLRTKWNEAKSALSMESMLSLDEKVALAKALGNPHVHQNSSEAELVEQITQIVEHLSVLMAYLDEQFKPTVDRLRLETSHGQISYDLLIYFFKVGDVLYSYDDRFGLPFAFTLHKRWYDESIDGSYFVVTAITQLWDGNKYRKDTTELRLRSFEGTKEISELVFQHLDSDMKEKLVARGKLYVTYSGIHYKQYGFDLYIFCQNRIMIDRTAYDYQGGYDLDPDIEIPELEEKKLHFLPPEVYGFNLSTKKWQSFLVDEIQPVVFDEKAWDHLVLDPDTKDLIKGLVEVTKNENTASRMVNDVISGKGGGLIAVLHGPPGTGKTLTAEAVAENLQRPLYMVGSTELSTSPMSLERNLKLILKVLKSMIPDVFLEQRSLHELERNALVSVALRVLEYHRGVLFLTTNRIKT
ncbi:hypothetical protein K435DRAFT_779208, partial [Dendrothele bispora CBS 962.96]